MGLGLGDANLNHRPRFLYFPQDIYHLKYWDWGWDIQNFLLWVRGRKQILETSSDLPRRGNSNVPAPVLIISVLRYPWPRPSCWHIQVAGQSSPMDHTTCLYHPVHGSHSVLHCSPHTPIWTTKGMLGAGENTQTDQTQTRASCSSGSQRVGKRQEHTRRGNSPEYPPHHSELEHPPRGSEPKYPARDLVGESN